MKQRTITANKVILILPLILTLLTSWVIFSTLQFDSLIIHSIIDIVWLGILTVLNYNIYLITILAILSATIGYFYRLPEVADTDQKAALVFSLKHESNLLEKIVPSVNDNLDALSEVIIISNSTDPEFINQECFALEFIRNKYGLKATIFPAKPPKHIGIYKFCEIRTDIEYIISCDADSYYPPGSIKRLIAKAEHPHNKNIAIFQSNISANKGHTIFSQLLSQGQNIAGKLYALGFFIALGQSGYYGSGALIRRADFAEVGKVIEEQTQSEFQNIKSHDVWEAVTLPKISKNVAYISDINTYEDFPANFMEMINRDRRWVKGTFQSRKALEIKPEKNTISTYFLLFFPIFMYFSQPVFLLWIILGLMRLYVSNSTHVSTEFYIAFGIISLLYIQKFFVVRSLKEFVQTLAELIYSTIFYLNTPIFTTINLFNFFLHGAKGEWIPMRKDLAYHSLLQHLWVFKWNMLLGVIMFTILYDKNQQLLIFSLPIVLALLSSGIFSFFSQFRAFDYRDFYHPKVIKRITRVVLSNLI